MKNTKILNLVFTTAILILIGILFTGIRPKEEPKPWEGRWILSKTVSPEGDINANNKGIMHNYADGKFTLQLVFPNRLDLEEGPKTLEEYENILSNYRACYGTITYDENAGTMIFSRDFFLHRNQENAEKIYTYQWELTPDGYAFTCSKGYKFYWIR
jgi:hypothetical protein